MEHQIIITSGAGRLQRARYYMGGYWVFLVTGKETGGRFSLLELNLRKGLEPPRHTHTYEDESFHVLEGSLRFVAGDRQADLGPGDFIHIPKGTPHHFLLQTDRVKMLAHLAPAGLEELFWELSQPAGELDYPALPAGPPPAEWLEKLRALQQHYGIVGIDNSKIKAE